MNCKDVRPLFDLKLDGEIAPTEEEQLATHLRECESCRLEFDLLSRIELATGSMGVERAPYQLKQAVLAEIERSAALDRRVEISLAVAGSGAFVYFVVRPVLFGLGLLTPERIQRAWNGIAAALTGAAGFISERAPALSESSAELSSAAPLLYIVGGLVSVFFVYQAVRLSRELATEWRGESPARSH